jgi:hypothetical protein
MRNEDIVYDIVAGSSKIGAAFTRVRLIVNLS